MADGRQVPSETGWARVRLEGREVYTPVIFAEEGEASLLGVTTLEVAPPGRRPHQPAADSGEPPPILTTGTLHPDQTALGFSNSDLNQD